MLKREHIKQAIDEISQRSPEIGYSLDELLGTGHIDTLPEHHDLSAGGDFRFQFNDEILTVRRFVFINHGSVAIQQPLLIKYGEMLKRREILDSHSGISYRSAAEEVYAAGLRFLVDYEIDLALERITRSDASSANTAEESGGLMDCLLRLKEGTSTGKNLPGSIAGNGPDPPIFRGVIGSEVPALFVFFPYCRSALEQAAELNLEFFHIRFLLDTLIRGNERRLFACMVDGHIAGLIYLGIRQRLFYRAIEIVYLATVKGRIHALPGRNLRGVGSFLVAGTWMLWKTRFPTARELVLDSELGAMRFYEALGFQVRRSFNYALKAPKAYLLDGIIALAESCPDLPARELHELAELLQSQIKSLASARNPDYTSALRKPTFRAVRRSLLSRNHSILAKTAAEALLRYRNRIPEADELLRIAVESSNLRFPERALQTGKTVAIVHDLLFAEHLKGVFHMESAHRIHSVDAALRDPSLAEKWKSVSPRLAEEDELAWVHTREHIRRIKRTSGKEIVSLDLDTQTTPRSFEVALTAVGGLFNLVDEIWNGDSRRGFAMIRPPGHHAEPDRAMGFCLFNNVALGARYLELVYGLDRVMIVDIDAHHGNGTQKIFYNTDSVLYASLHQFPGFPGTGNLGEIGEGRGEGFTVNIPMPKGSIDRDFAQTIHSVVRPIAEEYGPDALLVSCGFDLCQADRLAGMNGTSEGYAMMTFFLKEIADRVCDGRLIYVLEGGYNAMCVQECTLRTVQELSDTVTLDADRMERIRSNDPRKVPALRRAIDVHQKQWKSLR